MESNEFLRLFLFQNMQHINSMDTWKLTAIASMYIIYASLFKNVDKTFHFYSFYRNIIDGTFLKTKNEIILEGIRSSSPSFFSGSFKIDTIFSNSFKAIITHILQNTDNLKINSIKILSETKFEDDENGNKYIYSRQFQSMIEDKNPILLDKENQIYVSFSKRLKFHETKNNNSTTLEIEYINIYVYSYVSSISTIKKYIDNITDDYLSTICEYRKNKVFVYTMTGLNLQGNKKSEDSDTLNCDNEWKENIFQSSKTFSNTFFENKKLIIDKIDFFINNKNWYLEYGIPYTLGIGLYGPPGTGKTSFIKALANYTGRHLVCISLKDIKTREALERLFFENTYNSYNREGSIGFDKKIIVFEDIDCIGNIVIDRNSRDSSPTDLISNMGNATFVLNNGGDIEKTLSKIGTDTPQITLDDILNLWDGIRENSGRIMVITSNQYEKLDSALIRPGRIDVTLNLNNASHSTISDIYMNFYGKPIEKEHLDRIESELYSPAELINFYVKYRNNSDKFIERLLENRKI